MGSKHAYIKHIIYDASLWISLELLTPQGYCASLIIYYCANLINALI